MPRPIRPAGHGQPIISNDAIHRLLWARTDRRGVVRIHQKKLAEELAYTVFNMSRIIHDMIAAGRIEKLGTSQGNVATYIVVDPTHWQGVDPPRR